MASRSERKELSRIARRREDAAVSRGVSLELLDPTKPGKKRGKTPATHRYGVECRWASWSMPGEWGPWHAWGWYATPARRDQAYAALSREPKSYVQYRKSER